MQAVTGNSVGSLCACAPSLKTGNIGTKEIFHASSGQTHSDLISARWLHQVPSDCKLELCYSIIPLGDSLFALLFCVIA